MRTLVIFITACVLLLGVAIYSAIDVTSGRHEGTEARGHGDRHEGTEARRHEGEGTGNREQGTELESTRGPNQNPAREGGAAQRGHGGGAESESRGHKAGSEPQPRGRDPQPAPGGAPAVSDVPLGAVSSTSAPAGAASSAAAPVHWADDGAQSAERRLRTARATLAREPDHQAALRDAAAALAELGRWDEAERSFARLRALRPDDNSLAFEHAAVLLRLRRNVDAAEVLGTLVARDPNDARAWFNLAVANQQLGRLEAALAAWDRAITLDEIPAARLQRGTLRLDLHDWAGAADDFGWVLAHEPLSIDASHNLATAYRHLGRFEDARGTLRAVLEAKPSHVPTLNRLAELTWLAANGAAPSTAPSTADRDTLLRETIEYCERSLAIDAAQSDVAALLAEARQQLPDHASATQAGHHEDTAEIHHQDTKGAKEEDR